jgi:hypothetical protein
MFEVEGVEYDLTFNQKKLEQIEKIEGVSLMDILVKTNGLIGFSLLKTLFTTGLVVKDENKAVNGQKAVDIFNKAIEEVGYSGMASAVLDKFTNDMGFLFR